MSARELITERLDLWTGAVTKKSSSGRGSNGKVELTGVKKLRELILELAVHGKLVEQYPADTPADQLLERIAERRNELISSKKIKNSKPLPPVTPDEAPSELPVGWVWTRLGSIAEINPRNLGDDTLEASFIPMPLVTTSYHGEHGDEPRKWGDIKKGYSHFANGDVGLAKITPCFENSKAAVFRHLRNGIGAGTTELHVARPLSPAIDPYFLLLFLKSPKFLTEGEKVMTGSAGQKRVPKGYFSETPLPLPPEEEQHRIVQKVDELMALCDRLEQQTSDQLEAHETLVETLLGILTQSESATELADNWARLSAHFDTLFITEQSIDKLKQTILQLAVMGRLVDQDAGDEPAESMVTKIDQEITSLVKRGQIKKPKPTPEISNNDKFFETPGTWQWVRLGRLALHSEAGWSPKCHDAPRDNQGWAVLKVSAVTWGEFRPGENKALPSNLTPRPEYEVHPSDFLISRANTSDLVARSVVVPKGTPTKLMMSDKIIRFVFSNQIDPLYVNLFNNSSFARSYYLSVAGGTSSSMKNVSRAQIQALAVPLPPRAEQTRIVKKVDELMMLCGKLKVRLKQVSETRCELAEAAVKRVLLP
ncbi:restriction endonuclease subunit S [Haliea atlantica]